MPLFCPVAIPSCSSLYLGGVVSGVLLVVLSVVLCNASLSDYCTRVCESLVHSDVQILRFAVAVAVPLGAAKQRFIWSSGGLWVRPARLGLSPTPRAAAHFACDESSRYSTVIGLCRTFEETSGRHCRVGRHFCQCVILSPPGGSPDGARRVSCVGLHS